MAFNILNGGLWAGGTILNGKQLWTYSTSDDSMATVTASGYFNDLSERLTQNDLVWIVASNDQEWARVTSATGAETVTVENITGDLDSLAQGSIFVGNASSVPTALSANTDGNILIGNGTTVTSVPVTGDIGLSNAGVASITADSIVDADINSSAAIAYSKLAALTDGNVLIGNASNVATSVAVTGDVLLSNAGVTSLASEVIVNADISNSAAIDFSKLAALTSTNILVGNGSNVPTAVAVSGDATLANTGAITIADSAITTAKIADQAVDGGQIANDAIDSAHVEPLNIAETKPNFELAYTVLTAGGATADTDIVIDVKMLVTEVLVINLAAGTVSDTITVKNGSDAITEAIDISVADGITSRNASIDLAYTEIPVAGTLRVTETDGGGNDSPSCMVIVKGIKTP